jgi:hypothetical protein
VDYDGLWCQREVNLRDAKQYGGLEAGLQGTPPGGTHAAHLSLLRGNVASCLRADSPARDPDYRVLDLTADDRGDTYVAETIQRLPEKPEPVLLAKILHEVAGLGRIHATPPSFSFS